MELDAYIDSLIEQGLNDSEIAVKIEEFKANQTTDENFQQDGVAGAGAPSVIAAPTDTESQPDLGFLDLQDPVQPTPAPFRPEALTEEQKALENQRRQELQPIDFKQLKQQVYKPVKKEFPKPPTDPEGFKKFKENFEIYQKAKSDIKKQASEILLPQIEALDKNDLGAVDFKNVEQITDLRNETLKQFITLNPVIKDNIIPRIKKQKQADLDSYISKAKDKYGFNNPENLTQENIDAYLNDVNSFYSTTLNAAIRSDSSFKKYIKLFQDEVDSNLKPELDRFQKSEYAPNLLRFTDFTEKIGLGAIGDVVESAYAGLKQVEAGAEQAGLVAGFKRVTDKINDSKKMQTLIDKSGGDDSLQGVWINNPQNLEQEWEFIPKKQFGENAILEKDTAWRSILAGNKGIIEGTWGEFKSQFKDWQEKSDEQNAKRSAEVQNNQLMLSSYDEDSFNKILKGENVLANVTRLASEQLPQMGLALVTFGASSGLQIGGDIYTSGVENEARKRFNVSEDLKPTVAQLREVVGDEKFMENLENKAVTGGFIAGQLERFGAGKALKPFTTNTAKSMLRGGYKNFLKKLANGTVANTQNSSIESITEVLQETIQASLSGGEIKSEQLFEAGGTGFISSLAFGVTGNVKNQSVANIKDLSNKIAAKLNPESSEAIFNNQVLQIDKLLKTETNTEVLESLKEKKEVILQSKEAAVKIPSKFSVESKQEALDLIVEKTKLENEIKGKDSSLIENDQSKIAEINTKLKALSNKEQIRIQTETVKSLQDKVSDLTVESFKNDTEIQNYLKEQQSLNEDVIVQASAQQGFILQDKKTGKQTIVLNEEVATKEGAVNVAAHEFLHSLLFKTFSDNSSAQLNVGNALIEEISKIDINKVTNSEFLNRLNEYRDKPANIQAEEAITLFSDAIKTGDIKFNENVFTKIGDVIRRVLQQAGLSKIKFNTGRDVYNFVKDYNTSIEKGKLTRAQKQVAAEGATGALTQIKPIDEQAANIFKESKSQEDSKTKQTLDGFTGPAEARKYNTKAEFEASPDYLSAYNYFTGPNPSLDARINSVAAGKGVDFIDVQKVKDNLSLRFVQNFDVSKNSLFGWMLGKTPALNFAVLDVIKEETAKTPTTTTTTAEGTTIDIADDVNIEDQIDTAMAQQTEAPRSALKQELQKDGQQFVDQVLEDAIETNTIEIFEGAKPEFTDAALVPFLKQASQQKSFKQIKNKIGDAMTFLKDNDNYKTLFHSKNLPVSVLVAMERNVPVADRIFTGEPTRLTTQDQINKAVNDGDFYVENEKTGPSIYPRKKPTVEQLEKFFNVPAVNPVTGKRSGLKGTRKDGLVNAVSFGLFRDITPSVMRKLDKPAADIAKTAEKLVVDPTIKFSQTLRTTLDLTSKDISFKNISQIKSARVALGKLSGRLGIENTMKYLLPTVQSGWGLIGGRFVVNNKTVNKFLQVREEEKGIRTRQFLAVGRGDYFKNVVKNIFPGIKYEKGSTFVTYNNKKIETTKIPNQSPKGFISGKYNEKMQDRQNFALDQRKGLQFIVNELTYLYENGDISKNDLGMILATFNSSVNALIRTAALPGLSFKSKDFNNDSDYRYEHTKVARSVLGEISKLITDKNYDKTFDEILEDYRVAIIPKVYDDIVNKYFSQSQPTDENGQIIPGKGTFVARYEDPRVKKDFKEAGLQDLKLQELKFSKSEPQTSVEIIEDMKQFDTFGMADIVASRLFENEFKNLPSFKQNYNSLTNEQKVKVQREMLKQNLAPAKFNNRLLPVADRLTGEFTNDQVIAKMQEIDNKNIENEIKFSKSANLNKKFNEIIERSTGISATATISEARAATRGAKKGKFDFFISPSAEDFVGLLYKTLGKGEQGNADLKFYDDHLLKPFAKANNAITRERLALMDDYKAIKKQIGVVPKDLRKKLEGEDFTREQAVRVYIWTKQGMSIPGLTEGDLKKLLTNLKKFPELISFGNQLININKGDGYAAPQNNWLAGSITTDLLQGINTTKRAKHLQQWQENVDIIFSKDNLNKLEAAYGKQYVEALKNMLLRMKTGRNRTYGTDSLTGKVTDWINGSVGAIMFFNTRSAVLQLMSATNFINFSDNNIFSAGKAFANQKQYWKDFVQLFNSDFLLARRDGLRMNVNEADIAEMAKKRGVRGVINELLRFGFTPTQLADSFAIAAGGSTFYRNRINTYLKETDVDGNKIYTQKEAETKAFEDFRESAEESQQSSRPDKLSQQQTGSLGRLVLAFANTPSQYARIIKKAALDLKNGRGDAKTNISKIVYYTFAQNLLFNALQQGLFAMAFGDDDDDEKQKQKNIDVANGMANSLLRGMGFYGAAVAAVKDSALRIYKESEKDRPKYEKAAIDFLNISPPISSKYRKIASAGRIIQYENGQIKQKGISIDNPAVVAGSRVVSAATNIPLDRLVTKVENINGALNQDVEYWQSIAMLLGWQDWQIGIETDKDKKEKDKAVGIKRREVERREVKRR